MYNGWRWVGQLDVREACYELSIRGLKTWLAGRLTQPGVSSFCLGVHIGGWYFGSQSFGAESKDKNRRRYVRSST